MLVDLALNQKVTLIIGVGEEVKIRGKQLAEEKAKIVVLTDSPTRRAVRSAGWTRTATIRPEDLSEWGQVLKEEQPFLVIVSTGDMGLDEEISAASRAVSKLVYVVDKPHLNDLNMTGIARIGDIRVAVSTGGMSPAMAGVLRRKIESLIATEDVLQVRLQGELRAALKKSISDPSKRKKAVYKVIRDKRISSLLRSSKYEDARLRALFMIEKFR